MFLGVEQPRNRAVVSESLKQNPEPWNLRNRERASEGVEAGKGEEGGREGGRKGGREGGRKREGVWDVCV